MTAGKIDLCADYIEMDRIIQEIKKISSSLRNCPVECSAHRPTANGFWPV